MRSRFEALFILGRFIWRAWHGLRKWYLAGSYDLYRHALTAFVVRGCNASRIGTLVLK